MKKDFTVEKNGIAYDFMGRNVYGGYDPLDVPTACLINALISEEDRNSWTKNSIEKAEGFVRNNSEKLLVILGYSPLIKGLDGMNALYTVAKENCEKGNFVSVASSAIYAWEELTKGLLPTASELYLLGNKPKEIARLEGKIIYDLSKTYGMVFLVEEEDEAEFISAYKTREDFYGLGCDVNLWYADSFKEAGSNYAFMKEIFPLVKDSIPVKEMSEDWNSLR